MQVCTNLVGGEQCESRSQECLDVTNPATSDVIARLPLSTNPEVDAAVANSLEAYREWSQWPVVERARVLFHFRAKLEEHRAELTRLVVIDNGKTTAEAAGSVQRGLEVVEFAAGLPSLSKGDVIKDIARGIDCEMIRQPLGVVAGFTPFNFPVMVPLWTIPIALACGNTYVLKPSERAPLATVRLVELFSECGAPAGTLNVVHGAADVAERLMAHADVQAISVVGSSPIAQHVYATAARHGKRVQALGGAKNSLIVMPDARLPSSVDSIIASAYGCAGQRCLAGSNVIAVGAIADAISDQLAAAASRLKLGNGLDPDTTMGPVITAEARQRTLDYVEEGIRSGVTLVCDGREDHVADSPKGYFVGPTLFDHVTFDMKVAQDEIFGPLLNIIRVPDLETAIEQTNAGPLGNSASIYTTSGAAARQFQQEIHAGMLGINLGVPAPMAFFPFSGWKGSFFGDLHAQGEDGIQFYTRCKVVTSRWRWPG